MGYQRSARPGCRRPASRLDRRYRVGFDILLGGVLERSSPPAKPSRQTPVRLTGRIPEKISITLRFPVGLKRFAGAARQVPAPRYVLALIEKARNMRPRAERLVTRP